MKKLLKIITGVTLSLAMAIGVGIGVASNNKKAEPVYATSPASITISTLGWGSSSQNAFGSENAEDIDNNTAFYFSGGGNAGKYYTTSPSGARLYYSGSDSVTVVAKNSVKLTSVTFTYNIKKDACLHTSKGLSVTAAYGSGSAVSLSNVDSITAYVANTGTATDGQVAITNISVSYQAGGGGNTPATYTVTYDSNGGTGTMTDTSSPYTSGASVTVKSNTFTRDGYSFNHWDTAQDDSGTDYAPGATFTIGANTTLYAQWSVLSRTVTYDSNNATSGSAPTDATVYDNNASVTVLGNTGSLSKTGYIWSGWNTEADGTGISYLPGSTFSITSATTLYARWITDYSDSANIVISAGYLNLNTTGFTNETKLTADDGMQYIAAASGGSNKVKATDVGGNNAFDSLSPAILMGQSGAYIYNKDAFQKDIGRIEIFANSGASTAVSVAVDFANSSVCSESYTTNAKVLNTTNTVFAFNPSILNARFFRIQVTNAKNAQIQVKVVFRIATTSLSVSPNSVTLAPGVTQQLTPTIAPANTTDVLTYTSNATSVATVSDSGLITAVADGIATITVTSGSYNDTCIVTVETPEEPFINPSKNSTSGYTGQHDTISFTYGNLTAALGIASNNTGVATVEEPSTNAGSGTVQVNFVGAGSTTISFKNGNTQIASVSVSVTASSVTITGLPNTGSVDTGKTLNLGSTITITPVGACSNTVTWTSADPAIATVSSSGVVTGVSMGIVNITVASTDYPSATMTCAVTVFEVVDLTDDSYAISKPATAQTELSRVLVSGYTLNVLNGYHVSPGHTYLILGNKDLKTTDSLISNKTPTIGPITKIVINIKAGSAGEAVYNATLSDSEIKSPVTNNTYTRTGPGSITITADAGANKRYFGISVSNDRNGQIENIEIFYEKPTASEAVESLKTRSSLTYHYSYDGASYEFSKVGIRYSGFISKALWDSLNAESPIQGYGIYYSTSTNWNTFDLKDFYPEDDGVDFRNFYTPLTSKEHPDLANASQKGGLLEDCYVWSLFKTISEGIVIDESILETAYTAVAYIKTEDGVVFLDQEVASVVDIAVKLIDDKVYNEEAFEGSLAYLAYL